MLKNRFRSRSRSPEGKTSFDPPNRPATRGFRGSRIERSGACDLLRWKGGLTPNKTQLTQKKEMEQTTPFSSAAEMRPHLRDMRSSRVLEFRPVLALRISQNVQNEPIRARSAVSTGFSKVMSLSSLGRNVRTRLMGNHPAGEAAFTPRRGSCCPESRRYCSSINRHRAAISSRRAGCSADRS
jgi:hypothetical protein